MCRYAQHIYKPHYACFACRKAFKRRLLSDAGRSSSFTGQYYARQAGKEAQRVDSQKQVTATCPDCGGLMADMGRDFAAPPRRDEKAWQHLAHLFAAGIAFHSCGCSGPGLVPANHTELVGWLQERRDEYVKNQRFWLNKKAPTTRQELAADRDKYYVEYGKVFSLQGRKGGVEVAEAVAYWQARVQDVEAKLQAALAHAR